MKYLMILLVSFILIGCEREPCPPKIAIFYEEGQKATHIPTGEQVRIVSKWIAFGGDRCRKVNFSEYNIRFSDGVEIGPVSWEQLRVIE